MLVHGTELLQGPLIIKTKNTDSPRTMQELGNRSTSLHLYHKKYARLESVAWRGCENLISMYKSHTRMKWKCLRIESNRNWSQNGREKWLESCTGLLGDVESAGEAGRHESLSGTAAVSIKKASSWIHPRLGSVWWIIASYTNWRHLQTSGE